VTKVLTIVEENHSLEQMKAGMPYLYSLAQRFAYANNYVAIRHPSLPNYLAIAGGDTFGVSDDAGPASHPLSGQSVFGQAIAHARTAGVYAESMPGNCVQSNNAGYVVKHNPWPYFVDERALCNASDTPETGFGAAVGANALPNAGMLIPNLCNDAHDCSLGTADSWLKNRLPNILASSDFTSGKLAVVVTADEDDSASGNKVLTVVLHASLDGSHKVVSTALTHYSLSRFYSQTNGGSPLRKAAAAPDMAQAFGLTVGPTSP
jgi:acid phosphatase